MYDIKWIREHPEAFDHGLERRGLKPKAKELVGVDQLRRVYIGRLEAANARRKQLSEAVHVAKRNNDKDAIDKSTSEVTALKEQIREFEEEERKTSRVLSSLLAELPNIPADEVPDGPDSTANLEDHHFGEARDYAFKPKQHFELGETLGLMDFKTAAKLSGARFVILKGALARLERALAQFMLDLHTGKHGYTEIDPPLLVRDAAMFGTAQLPKFERDQFRTSRVLDEDERMAWHDKRSEEERTADQRRGTIIRDFDEAPRTENLWLIPTAEVPLTNLVRELIVDENKLPMRLTACTPCFRAEAGAAGKDTRGMIRQHQFTKVELVSITKPEDSKQEHERMLACAEEVLKKLDLHYRVLTLCTGDMGFAAQKTYDIEVWLPGQSMYREISSCSNCGDFQARRMHPPGKPSEGTRYRGKDGKIKGFVHTLNGSGVAVGRALIAVMETYQDDKGAIVVPEALKPYMGGVTKIEKAG